MLRDERGSSETLRIHPDSTTTAAADNTFSTNTTATAASDGDDNSPTCDALTNNDS
jgi:hypothetical protein